MGGRRPEPPLRRARRTAVPALLLLLALPATLVCPAAASVVSQITYFPRGESCGGTPLGQDLLVVDSCPAVQCAAGINPGLPNWDGSRACFPDAAGFALGNTTSTYLAASYWQATTSTTCTSGTSVYAGTASLARTCVPLGTGTNQYGVLSCNPTNAVLNYFTDAACTVASTLAPVQTQLGVCLPFYDASLNRNFTRYFQCLPNVPGQIMAFPVAPPAPPPPPPPAGPNIGAIVGGVLGGVVALGLLAGLFFWWRKRAREAEAAKGNPNYTVPTDDPGAKSTVEVFNAAPPSLPVPPPVPAAPTASLAIPAGVAAAGSASVPWNTAAPSVPYLDAAVEDLGPGSEVPWERHGAAAAHDVMAPAALPAPPPLATPAAQAAAAASVLVVAAAASSPTPARSATDPTSTSSPPQPPHVSKLLVPASEITVLRDKKIGEGSFGVVHQGLLRGTIPVAVKSLKGEADDKVMQAFFREVGTWEGLVQRNVLPLMAYSADPPMMVTDYVPDGNLRKYLSARSWPRDAGLRLLLDVARGMVYLHGLGILHGDLKSLNVLVDGGKSLIADFGLSRVRSEVGRSTAGTVGGHVSGTPGFLAPEMVAGHPLGKPADVYAFAMVCYEVLSGGKYPFEDLGNPAVVLYNAAVLGTRPPRPEGVPDALWGLVVRCWDQDPGKRPAFATVAEELGKIVGATGPV